MILFLAPRHGVVATVVFVAIGVAVVLVGWRQPGGEQKGWTPTLVLIGRRKDPLASASDLFDTVLGSRTARIAILVLWWWLGWHFLVAQTVDPN